MSDDLSGIARAVGPDEDPVHDLEFSFCTLVTNTEQYRAMVGSMRRVGFDDSCAEYLYLDNREGSQGDGYTGLNRLANAARGRLVILCHQDLLAVDGPDRLRAIVAEMDANAPDWAVLGNAGVRGGERFYYLNEKAMVIAGPTRRPPEPVASLDEDLLILRQDARLGFSHDLQGFHFYGTDLVTQAQLRGHSAHVVDFRVEHLGAGRIDQTFWDACARFEAKYRRALTPRAVATTCATVHIGGMDARTLRRRARDRELGPDHVGWAHRAKRALRGRLSGHRLTLEGVTFRCPPEVPFATYRALRKGSYKAAERALIGEHLPRDLPVVHLGAELGVLSGLINLGLAPEVPLAVVASGDVALCRENALAGGKGRVEVTAEDTGASFRGVLANALGRIGVDGPYALVCDFGGEALELLGAEPEVLAGCRVLIARFRPEEFYARGKTILDAFGRLEAAGFKPLGSGGDVVAAGR